MRRAILLMSIAVAVVFVQLLGAVRAVELMALAGNTQQGNDQQQQGEWFHRAAS